MSVRFGHLYEQCYDPIVVQKAVRAVIAGEHKNKIDLLIIQHIRENLDTVVDYLCDLMEHERWYPWPPTEFDLEEGPNKKPRHVKKPVIDPDQLVHRIVMDVMEPVFMRGMYSYSCGNVPGRGGELVRRYLNSKLQEPGGHKKYKYCLKMDIRHFFDSIDHEILYLQLMGVIKDRRMLHILRLIIESTGPGLPIGYYPSQWLANFYLQGLDHYIKEHLYAPIMVRYVDDIVICGSNKRRLHHTLDMIRRYLKLELHLELKPNYQIFPVADRGIDFCGFRFYPCKTVLRKSILDSAAKVMRKVEDRTTLHNLQSAISYSGWFDHTDTREYVKKYFRVTKHDCVKRFKILNKSDFTHEKQLLADLKKRSHQSADWLVTPLDSE
jgi:retron-type reverse transcriptase